MACGLLQLFNYLMSRLFDLSLGASLCILGLWLLWLQMTSAALLTFHIERFVVDARQPSAELAEHMEQSGLIRKIFLLLGDFNPSEKKNIQLGLVFPIYGKKQTTNQFLMIMQLASEKRCCLNMGYPKNIPW